MKALTNILNYILLLMMILIASCTEETAEVDNLTRGEQYVTVRMQVPGMKNATTRAEEAEDNLTSVVVLVFRNDALVSKTEVTTASSTLTTTTNTTGTFNIPRPKSGDVIHFLGNLPETVKNSLPATGGTQEDVLRGLITGDDKNLSYWGTATYTSGDVIDNVTLYRNMAKIEIAPDPNECTFPEDQLFIVGLFNANQSGALVPYNGSFNFDLTTNDYFTLPADVETETDETIQPLVTSLYVFEHDNPDAYTEANKDNFFCVICQIGKDYYKVALTSDGKKPYDIIRNHKYTILVKDLDEGAADYPTALTADPINLEIKVEKEVALQLIQEGIDENGNELEIQQGDIDINSHANSTEEVTIKVVVPAGVKTLTVQADGFTVTSGDAGDDREMTSDGNNQYTIKEAYRNQENIVRFKLKLNDDVDAETATKITVSGEGEDQYTTVTTNASTTITVTPASETEGTIWWQGLMILDAMDDETKISIPKSYFFNGETPLIPVGSQIVFDFENVTGFLSNTDDDYLRIWMQAADPSDWSQVASQDFVYDGNRATLNVTQEVLDDILDTANDNALIIQGQGRILKKITLIRAIIATPDKTQLYYDSDDTQVVTINVTVPDGVETLNISATDFKFDGGDSGSYTYTVNGQTNISLSLTLKSGITEAKPSTVTISDASGNATEDAVIVNLVATPTVTFTNTGSQTLYWNNGKPTTLQVQMNGTNVPNDKTVTLTIEAPDFTVTAQNGTPLTQNDDVWTYTGTLTTLTFTPTSSGDDKPIYITGEGENVNVNPASISVDVDATLLAVTSTATIDMDNSETSTTLTLTKPGNIMNLKVTASNNNAFTINGNAINDNCILSDLSSNNETINYTIALQDGFDTAGEYTITFTDNDGGGQSVTATITVKNTPSLQFEYEDNTILYLDGGDGSPTTLPVTITVPVGSSLTQLNITATGFTVTASSEGLSGSEGSYTYTGGSTSFTFVPTKTTATTIKFTGTGTNLKAIDKTIIVTVKETKPAVTETELWTGTSTDTNNFFLSNLSSDLSKYMSEGNIIKVYFTISYYGGDSTVKDKVWIQNNWGGATLVEGEYSGTDEKSISLELTQSVLTKIDNNATNLLLITEPKNIVVSKITVVTSSTQ